MQISVIIPFYNGEDYIEDAVDSVLAQTCQPYEIIIVNDSPSKESHEFLSRFKGKAKIVNHEINLGNSYALNTGIRNSSCDWIALLDQDDLWMPEKLEKQVNYLEAHPEVDACHTGLETFSGEIVISRYVDKPLHLELCDALMIAPVLPSSLLIRKSALEQVGLFDTNTVSSSDRDLTIRLLREGIKIDFVNQVLTRLRRDEADRMTSRWKPMFKGHMYILRKHFDLFREYGYVRSYLRWTFLHAAHRAKGAYKILFTMLGRLI